MRIFPPFRVYFYDSISALTIDQYKDIISTMRDGFIGCKPNERIATALTLEANLGLRISDILALRLNDIVLDGERYHLNIVEKKTGKRRCFTVPVSLYQYIKLYCMENHIQPNQKIFNISERQVQRQLKIICDFLGYENISTHSFRKMFATQIYKNSGYNIQLVQKLLQHSSAAITQRYIGIESREIEDALERHLLLGV